MPAFAIIFLFVIKPQFSNSTSSAVSAATEAISIIVGLILHVVLILLGFMMRLLFKSKNLDFAKGILYGIVIISVAPIIFLVLLGLYEYFRYTLFFN